MPLRIALVFGAVLLLLVTGCSALVRTGSELSGNLNTLVKPYSFNFASWEFNAIFSQIKQSLTMRQPAVNPDSQDVIQYFAYLDNLENLKSSMNNLDLEEIPGNINRMKEEIQQLQDNLDNLRPVAEDTIAWQITQTLAAEGIFNPFNNWLNLTFPPVKFKLEKPLYILVVSPRDKIERINTMMIKSDISIEQIEELEDAVDRLNVSSLVVEIGGLGATYPSFVIQNADLRFTIDTACEEWLHQYLAFKPLGFGYILQLLGAPVNPGIPTLNETVAGVAAKELGALVYNRYYAEYQKPPKAEPTSPAAIDFDFNQEMREIRKTVDQYLAGGEIQSAEEYMQEKQQFLASKGYYIRKLNQAYFAFYGSYAYSPTSIDPIGDQVRLLREHSQNLQEFLSIASKLKTPADLEKTVSQYE